MRSSLEELEDYPRTQLRRRKPADPLNGPSERTTGLVPKLEGQFLNSSRWLGVQKSLDSLDQYLLSNLAERLSYGHVYSILKSSSADVEFPCKVPKPCCRGAV